MILTWTSRENSLELIELSSINKVSLVDVSFCSKNGSIRHDPYMDLEGEQFRTDSAIQQSQFNLGFRRVNSL
jgi:hypothetical protein